MKLPRLLFVHENEITVQDGLSAALELLKRDFEVTTMHHRDYGTSNEGFDFVLGWGAFGSEVDNFMNSFVPEVKRGLCVGSSAGEPRTIRSYGAVFYETQWDFDHRLQATGHPNLVHAFGVNTSLFYPRDLPTVWDYVSVGALSLWKRQSLLTYKTGNRLVVGQVQKQNLGESLGIADELLAAGVGVIDSLPSDRLALLYNMTNWVYIPAELHGGGERAVLEARASATPVMIEPDNPKLHELLTSPVWDEQYYASQLKKGIQACLK